jgi:three-Cys-motif partner protein
MANIVASLSLKRLSYLWIYPAPAPFTLKEFPLVSKKDFFATQTQGSEVKTEIVRKYFGAWAGVMTRNAVKKGYKKIGYADLFAGKGRYLDGSKSTPILILESALRDKRVSEMLVSIFNDANKNNKEALEKEIRQIPGIELLAHAPRIINREVNDALAEKFEKISTIPTLYFLDPWGYKGLSLRLIKAVLRPPGCDCIFFFNYNRINAALSNLDMEQNMNLFFGRNRADKLRADLFGKRPKEREDLIIAELKRALRELGGSYTVEYFFKDAGGRRTKHFLILTSKVALAERIMKEIMAKESSADNKGFFDSFGYSPLEYEKARQGSLFDVDPRDELGSMLLSAFSGRTLKVREIYRTHTIGRRYTLRNYKDAINKLDSNNKVQTNPSAEKRWRAGKLTLSDEVIVTFASERKEE